MKIKDIAKALDLSDEAVRVLAQQGKFPFITVRDGLKRSTYYVNDKRFRLWQEGKL